MKSVIYLLAALALTGCATKPAAPVVQTVSVAVPVACQEPAPDKPVLPVDSLPPDAPLDAVVRSMIASIERQAGYALQLEAALANCRAPIPQTTYGLSGRLDAKE